MASTLSSLQVSCTFNGFSIPPNQHLPSQSEIGTTSNTQCQNQQSKILNANAPIFTPSTSDSARKYESKLDTIQEEPAHKHLSLPNRLRGIVSVSRHLTKNVIPTAITEDIYDIYDFMDKSMAFTNNKQSFSGHGVIIINFNFHAEASKKVLFCVIVETTFNGRRWRMLDKLFTVQMLQDNYGISGGKLPIAFQAKNCVDIVRQALQSGIIIHDIVNNTKWHKIKIHRILKKKERRVFHITKEAFIGVISKRMMNIKRILPIIVFDGKLYWTEYILIIHLTEELSIGISFKLHPLTVSGIYLDKYEMLRNHQLISLQHNCNCLSDFVSNIDDLEIGNIYNKENQIKALRKENQKLRSMVKSLQTQQDSM